MSRVVPALSGAGLCWLGLGLAGWAPIGWTQAGVGLLILAYWLAMVTTFVQRRPVRTREGIVRYEDPGGRYIEPFVLSFFFGVLAMILLLGWVVQSLQGCQ